MFEHELLLAEIKSKKIKGMSYHIITQNKQKNWTWVTTVETNYGNY